MGSAIKGSEPQQQVHIPPPLRPPMHGFANWTGNQLPSLWGQPLPHYGGNLDPGLSPTMTRGIQFLQDRASSSAPDILGRAQGALGALMNPGMSGLRNPYSMSTNSGGGSAMTQEALQSSRDAMMRFQNPQYQLPVPRLGQGAPSPFGMGAGGAGAGGQQPQPGGPVPRPMPPRPGTPGPFGMGGGGQQQIPQQPQPGSVVYDMMQRWQQGGTGPILRGQGPQPGYADLMQRFPQGGGTGAPGGGFLQLLMQQKQQQQPNQLQAAGKVF